MGRTLPGFWLENGHEVYGIKRRTSSFNTQRVDQIYQDPHATNANFALHYGDLSDSSNPLRILTQVRPDEVLVAAARVGGIVANNTQTGEFIHENSMIQAKVIHHAYEMGVGKLLFLGSNCILPKITAQPIREVTLRTGT